jgi:hypothetical protein
VPRGVDEQPTSNTLDGQQSDVNAVPSCDEVQSSRPFDVGRDELVVGMLHDPIGLVGCEITIQWANQTCRCHIDAYAPDAPDEPSYIISWVSTPDEHHLYTRGQMADAGARCSSSVKIKLQGFTAAFRGTAADELARHLISPRGYSGLEATGHPRHHAGLDRTSTSRHPPGLQSVTRLDSSP